MVWFGILDCSVFLPYDFSILLVTDVPIMTVFCVVAYIAITFSMS
jgi:hypothetical protein